MKNAIQLLLAVVLREAHRLIEVSELVGKTVVADEAA